MSPFAEAITSVFGALLQTAIPLYIDDENGKPHALGTGFFVRQSEESVLLISAAHVMSEARSGRVYYFIAPKVRRAVNGSVISDDLADLAAARLVGGSFPPYPDVDKVHLDADGLQFSITTQPTARYGAIGFPASRSRVRHYPNEIRVAPYGLLAEPAAAREYVSRRLDPESHLCLVFNRKKSFNLYGAGQSFPRPHGLSGAPVFEIFDEAKSHQGEGFPIAGVVTEWLPQQHRLICASATALQKLIQAA